MLWWDSCLVYVYTNEKKLASKEQIFVWHKITILDLVPSISIFNVIFEFFYGSRKL